jgi:hypothetical protein
LPGTAALDGASPRATDAGGDARAAAGSLRDAAAAAAIDVVEEQQGREQQPDNCQGPANQAGLLARRQFRDFRHLRSPGLGNCTRRLLARGNGEAEQRPNCRDCSHSERRETARKTAAITFSDVRCSKTSQWPEMQHQQEVGLVTRETKQRFPLAEFWFLRVELTSDAGLNLRAPPFDETLPTNGLPSGNFQRIAIWKQQSTEPCRHRNR